jgi:hypothetical protein
LFFAETFALAAAQGIDADYVSEIIAFSLDVYLQYVSNRFGFWRRFPWSAGTLLGHQQRATDYATSLLRYVTRLGGRQSPAAQRLDVVGMFADEELWADLGAVAAGEPVSSKLAARLQWVFGHLSVSSAVAEIGVKAGRETDPRAMRAHGFSAWLRARMMELCLDDLLTETDLQHGRKELKAVQEVLRDIKAAATTAAVTEFRASAVTLADALVQESCARDIAVEAYTANKKKKARVADSEPAARAPVNTDTPQHRLELLVHTLLPLLATLVLWRPTDPAAAPVELLRLLDAHLAADAGLPPFYNTGKITCPLCGGKVYVVAGQGLRHLPPHLAGHAGRAAEKLVDEFFNIDIPAITGILTGDDYCLPALLSPDRLAAGLAAPICRYIESTVGDFLLQSMTALAAEDSAVDVVARFRTLLNAEVDKLFAAWFFMSVAPQTEAFQSVALSESSSPPESSDEPESEPLRNLAAAICATVLHAMTKAADTARERSRQDEANVERTAGGAPTPDNHATLNQLAASLGDQLTLRPPRPHVT